MKWLYQQSISESVTCNHIKWWTIFYIIYKHYEFLICIVFQGVLGQAHGGDTVNDLVKVRSPIALRLLQRLARSLTHSHNKTMQSTKGEIANGSAENVLRVFKGLNVKGQVPRPKRSTHTIDNYCSGGYSHCGGYFPLCCEGFACWKPLTSWDKRYGFNRCWPDYFLPPKPDYGRDYN